MSKRLGTAVAALILIGLVAGATIAPGQVAPKFGATLKGSSEKPKGDHDGNGTFVVTFRNRQACYTLTARNIKTPVAAHIHKGAAGVNGPIVVDLKPSFTGTGKARVSAKCVTAKAAVIAGIVKNPAGYYANVHTADFPGGAIRGQLSKR